MGAVVGAVMGAAEGAVVGRVNQKSVVLRGCRTETVRLQKDNTINIC